MKFLIGDLLTGSKIQYLSPVAGSYSEVLNDSGVIECTVLLSDPVTKRLDLYNSAPVGKVFLAAVEDDVVLQAGPVWVHRFTGDKLTLQASGMWSYFDHRVVLPILGARLPTDPTTDTRFSAIVSDPNAPGGLWPTDTRQSLRTIAKRLVEQAQSWTYGNVPVILPSEESGTAERWYKGSDLALVGDKLRQLTAVVGGPDVMFTPRWKNNRTGIEWVMRVGTSALPLLASPQRQKFQVGVSNSSVTDLTILIDGRKLASNGFGSAGATIDKPLSAVASATRLTSAGYPQLDAVDTSHSTVSELPTLQGYANDLVVGGARPVATWGFTHDSSVTPLNGSYNAGDFCDVRVRDNLYVPDGSYKMRLLSRRGMLGSTKVPLEFAPEVPVG